MITSKVHVYLKQPQDKNLAEYPIYVRVTIDGKRFEFSLKRSCSPSKWNKHSGQVIGNTERARELNTYIHSSVRKVYEGQNEFIRSGVPVNAYALKSKLSQEEEKARMLVSIFKHHKKEMESLVGKEYSPLTLKRYQTSLNHVIEFMQFKYGFSDININQLDHAFITDFNFYLRTQKKCNNNSTVKYINNFKKIIRQCINNAWLNKDPFIQLKLKIKVVDREFLSEQELQVLMDKEFSIERINMVKDLFLFSCYTGLAYVDAKNLTFDNLVMGIDGNLWIHTHRKKTDTPSHIPLLPPAKAIIEKYKQHPKAVNNTLLLPLLSNQKMNAYLKEVADLCGITKNLTFHIARHTFATTVTLSNSVPIESVSKMLGHKSIRTTQHYAKILDGKVSKDMNPLISIYSPTLKIVEVVKTSY